MAAMPSPWRSSRPSPSPSPNTVTLEEFATPHPLTAPGTMLPPPQNGRPSCTAGLPHRRFTFPEHSPRGSCRPLLRNCDFKLRMFRQEVKVRRRGELDVESCGVDGSDEAQPWRQFLQTNELVRKSIFNCWIHGAWKYYRMPPSSVQKF